MDDGEENINGEGDMMKLTCGGGLQTYAAAAADTDLRRPNVAHVGLL
jgi:hypothetical protein